MSFTLRIVRTSSREKQNLLPERRAELEAAGIRTLYDELEPDPQWLYTAGSADARAKALNGALTETASDFVISARGGYGASDLLTLLDWERIGAAPAKLVIGFSDVSAIHSALYAQFGRAGLHAPMPATVLWRQNGGDDVDQLLAVLTSLKRQRTASGELTVQQVSPGAAAKVQGTLFGGCFTVLTALIGTAYLPRSLAGHILFLEDTGENPGRLMRCLCQWQQSGALAGVRAVVVGHLRELGQNVPDSAPFVLEEFARRLNGTPVFHAPGFGHTSPNFPLMVGAEATLAGDKLSWRYQAKGGAAALV